MTPDDSIYAPQWYSGKTLYTNATTFVVAESETVTHNFSLTAAAILAGRVTGVDRAAPFNGVADVLLLASNPEGSLMGYAQSGPSGYYRFEGLSAQPMLFYAIDVSEDSIYEIQIWKNTSDPTKAVPVDLVAGAVTTRDIALKPGVMLTGRVTGSDDPTVGISDVDVSIGGALGGMYGTTDSSGKYAIRLRIGGKLQVGFTPPQESIYTGEFWNNKASSWSATIIENTGTGPITANAELLANALQLGNIPSIDIAGDARSGGTVTATVGAWAEPAPTAYSYQWFSGGKPIAGATTKALVIPGTAADTTLTFVVSGTRSGYAPVDVSQNLDGTILAGTLAAGTPTITGTPAVGKKLAVKPGKWGSSTATFTYAWMRDGVAIAKATGSTYTPTKADAGLPIRVSVTASAVGFTPATAPSASVTIEKVLTKTPAPKVTGTFKAKKKLSAQPGTWAPSGVKFSYQWLRDGKAITGAKSSTYTLAKVDKKHKVSVAVTGKKTGYTSVTTTSVARKVK